MPPRFWIRRTLLVFACVFAGLAGVYLARGRATAEALREAALWAGLSTAAFIATRLYHASRGRRCALCNDLPTAPHSADAKSGEAR